LIPPKDSKVADKIVSPSVSPTGKGGNKKVVHKLKVGPKNVEA